MAIKSVIFDLDGTITAPFLDFELIRKEMGISDDALSILEVLDEMPGAERQKALAILEYHEDLAADNSTLNAGARETLKALGQWRIKIGILTRNKRSNVIAVQQKHRLYFDAIYAREDGPVKPHAHGVLHLCGLFGCGPAETLVVGDFIDDLTCARNAGAKAVLIKTHKNADLFTEYADFTISTLDKVLPIIENMASK